MSSVVGMNGSGSADGGLLADRYHLWGSSVVFVIRECKRSVSLASGGGTRFIRFRNVDVVVGKGLAIPANRDESTD